MTYATVYDPDADFDRWHTVATAEKVCRWIRPGDAVLELGCATGLMTAELVAAGAHVVAVDHSGRYLARARDRRLATVEWVEHDITTFAPDRGFDHVVATNVVHELDRPQAFLERCGRFVVPGGKVHVSLQNPRSLHRLVGLEMGLITALAELSERGRRFDTLRLLDRAELEDLAVGAGLAPVAWDGILVKPLPNQYMATLPAEVVRGLIGAARHLPDLASMYYVVLEPAESSA